MISDILKKKTKKAVKKVLFLLLQKTIIPIIMIGILLLLFCYISDIFYIGINNEEKSDMKKEIKYYTTSEYSDSDSNEFLKSIDDFINGIFNTENEIEILGEADWPVVGYTKITSGYGKRTAPTSGASTFHSRHRYCSTSRNKANCYCRWSSYKNRMEWSRRIRNYN